MVGSKNTSMPPKMTSGVAVRDLRDRVGHQEANREDRAVPGARELRQVALIVRRRLGLENLGLDAKLALGTLETGVRQVVERLVAQATDVGDHGGLDVGLRLLGRRCRAQACPQRIQRRAPRQTDREYNRYVLDPLRSHGDLPPLFMGTAFQSDSRPTGSNWLAPRCGPHDRVYQAHLSRARGCVVKYSSRIWRLSTCV